MAVPLNKIAQGLLDFFGIKAGEWGPRELGQVLQPVMELGEWYLHAYSLDVSFTAAAIVADAGSGSVAITGSSPAEFFAEVGSAGGLLVPQTERWLILEANAGWSFTAVAGASAQLSWRLNQYAPPQDLIGYDTSLAAASRTGTRGLTRPFWALPGYLLNVVQAGTVVGGGTVTPTLLRMRLVRFKL